MMKAKDFNNIIEKCSKLINLKILSIKLKYFYDIFIFNNKKKFE